MAPVTAFAHFSDPHLPLAPGTPRPVRLLAGKRLLSYMSWRLRRHARHDPSVLRSLCADVAEHAPDHTLITGDLTNISLPSEFAAARAWLEGLGAASTVSVVPGNHDALAPVPETHGFGLLRPWMTGDDSETGCDVEDFPFVRVRGNVAFVCLSSAVVTPPLWASGRLGADQTERAARALTELGQAGLFRVVGIHHPPVGGLLGRRKDLSDRAAFADVVAKVGAELIVHGHCHRASFSTLPGPRGPVPVVGAPSASARTPAAGWRARWHLFRAAPSKEGWRLSLTVREHGDHGGFATAGRWSMTVP